MRETRLSGSEGGAGQLNAPSLPLSPNRGKAASSRGTRSKPEGVSLLHVARSKSQPFAARHPSAQPATGRPLRSSPGRSHSYTWIVIAVRLSSTKACSAKADSSLPRLAANSCPISSLEMFPVETSSNRGG